MIKLGEGLLLMHGGRDLRGAPMWLEPGKSCGMTLNLPIGRYMSSDALLEVASRTVYV